MFFKISITTNRVHGIKIDKKKSQVYNGDYLTKGGEYG